MNFILMLGIPTAVGLSFGAFAWVMSYAIRQVGARAERRRLVRVFDAELSSARYRADL